MVVQCISRIMAGRFSRFFLFSFLFLFKSHTNYAKQSQHLTENIFYIFFTARNSILFLKKTKVNGTLTCENESCLCIKAAFVIPCTGVIPLTIIPYQKRSFFVITVIPQLTGHSRDQTTSYWLVINEYLCFSCYCMWAQSLYHQNRKTLGSIC